MLKNFIEGVFRLAGRIRAACPVREQGIGRGTRGICPGCDTQGRRRGVCAHELGSARTAAAAA